MRRIAKHCSPGAQHEGLKVADVVVLIDREQGGAARMASNGLRLHSAFTLSFIIGVLRRHALVSEQVAADVKAFIAGNQTFDASAPKPAAAPARPKRCALLLAVLFTRQENPTHRQCCRRPRRHDGHHWAHGSAHEALRAGFGLRSRASWSADCRSRSGRSWRRTRAAGGCLS